MENEKVNENQTTKIGSCLLPACRQLVNTIKTKCITKLIIWQRYEK
jgi:hypothetical protein